MQKRKITIKYGREEIQMEVTEEEYQRFYRPWWQQKKKEQRNREAMEAQGYRMESYEEWNLGVRGGYRGHGTGNTVCCGAWHPHLV